MKHTQEFVEVEYLKGNIKLLSRYLGAMLKNDLECLICGYLWKANYNSFQSQNCGCPNCAGLVKHTHEFVEDEYLKANIKLLSRYVNSYVKNDLECLICDHKWQATYNNFYSHNCGCPECNRLSRLGENNPNWNHELTKEDRENHRDRTYIPGYYQWRKSVFDRDNHTCQFCNVRGGSLEAHHIAGWSTHISERSNVENGVTLCETCHDSYHYDFNPSVIDHKSFYHWMVLYSVIKPENWLWTVQYPKSMNGWLKAFKQAS